MSSSNVVVLGTTLPITAKSFLLPLSRELAERGWDVHLVTSPGAEIEDLAQLPFITIDAIRMEPRISPLRDAWGLFDWMRTMRRLKPRVVVSGTPKAGLLGILAARLTGVPQRIYHVRGLRAEGERGLKRSILMTMERIACSSSTIVLANSHSLKDVLLASHLAPPAKVIVLGSGSAQGVDTQHFRPPTPFERAEARRNLSISDEDIAVGFAGRLTRDKGVLNLYDAMKHVAKECPSSRLVIAGSVDHAQPLTEAQVEALETPPSRTVSHWEDMRSFYWGLDIFCLPSFREGFPNVNLEAAACGLPVVTTTATGCIDSVRVNETGLTVAPGDTQQLAGALRTLIASRYIRDRLGQAGRLRVVREFAQDDVVRKFVNLVVEEREIRCR